MSSQTLTDKTCRQLSSVGLSQADTYRVITDLDRWVKCSGKEWTVDRVKSLRLEYLHRLAGGPYRAPWVTRDSKGFPSGVWGRIIRCDANPKQVQRSLIALSCHTQFVGGPRPTKAQWRKFITSVRAEPVELPDMVPLDRSVVRRDSEDIARQEFLAVVKDPIKALPSSPKRSVPRLDGTHKSFRESELALWLSPSKSGSGVGVQNGWGLLGDLSHYKNSALELFLSVSDSIALGTPGLPPDALFTERLGQDQDYPADMLERCENLSSGRISFIQEPGMKLRAVANPDRLLQMYLRPLKVALLRCLEGLEEDFTHDQEAGVRVVGQWLREGHTVSSVDLSDATNNFPLSYQRRVLDGHGQFLDSLLETFELASRLPWEVRDPEKGWTRTSWTKGQPLGLGPSFMAFALAHHSLARATLGPGNYVILGDDFVTKVDPSPYRAWLDELGVPVSESKTITSDALAEFAGRVITREGSYASPKWRGWNDRNFLDVVRNLGPKALKNLPRRQRRVAEVHALIPEFYGGLGWNPQGIPLPDRVILGIAYEETKGQETRGLAMRLRMGEIYRLRNELTNKFGDAVHIITPSNPIDQIGRDASLKERIIQEMHYLETKDPEAEGLPSYSMDVPSDPRGVTRLVSEERRVEEIDTSLLDLLGMSWKEPNLSISEPTEDLPSDDDHCRGYTQDPEPDNEL